jgi:hypothetical protein
MKTRLTFKDMRKFRDPRTKGPLEGGSVFIAVCLGAGKALEIESGNTLEVFDATTGAVHRARAIDVRLTNLQRLDTEELSLYPVSNVGSPENLVNQLKARYGDRLGSILTIIKLKLISR